jgi:hypothetical protein
MIVPLVICSDDASSDVNHDSTIAETDFIIGSYSSSLSDGSVQVPTCNPQQFNCESVMPSPKLDHVPAMKCDAYVECVRLLTLRLRHSSAPDGKLQCKDDIANAVDCSTTSTNDDWNEKYATASLGIPELITLQNTIMQLQNALNLVQQEACTAIHDASAAIRSSQYWKNEYLILKESVISVEQENRKLKRQSEKLSTDKRRLKAAYKKLLTQQHTVQSQQVESYVISALATHEQFLSNSNNNSTYTGKNRSRTTTIDTTGTTTGDEFTTLDDPFTDSPNNTIGFSDSTSSSPKEKSEVKKCTTSLCKSTSPSTIAAVNDHNKKEENLSVHKKGMNGFGNACHALGKTFMFIDNHVHKKPQQQHPVAHATESQSSTNNNGSTTAESIVRTENKSPIFNERHYAPICFDVITPTRSDDSNDSMNSHTRRMHFFQSLPDGKPTIDVSTLLDGPIDDSIDLVDSRCFRSTTDQILLSLPILPQSDGRCFTQNAGTGSLKSESPLSIPEEDETVYSDPTSGLSVQYQNFTCDPSLLRSLSIPTIPLHAQMKGSNSDLNAEGGHKKLLI